VKRLLTLLIIAFTFKLSAQNDTLLFENFEAEFIDYILELPPNGEDNEWLNYNEDGLPDASGNNRPGVWFRDFAFAEVDGLNQVMMSNSWTNNINQSVAKYLITPPIQIVDASAVLSWKSAPRQTPRYLDGYTVVAQVGGNVENNFTDTLAKFAEFIGFEGTDSTNFDDYLFSDGFVHGKDGEFVEMNLDEDPIRMMGVLRPESVSLAQYEGKTIYIAFVHNSTDDNLISIDDILITGTAPSSVKKIENKFDVEIFPNPAKSICNITIDLPLTTYLDISIYSVDGKLIKSDSKGMLIKGTHQFQLDVNDMAAGIYNVVFQTSKMNFGKQLIISQ
jgi:hypothetical protein